MPRYNGILTVRDYGSRRISVERVTYPLEIVSSSNAQARNRRAFYPVVTVESEFTLSLVWVSEQERERFNTWMRRYMTGVSDKGYGYMTVTVPSRKFSRIAVPQGPLHEGAKWDVVGLHHDLKFTGASDPVNLDLSAKQSGISYVVPPKSRKAKNFYPWGTQAKGDAQFDPATAPIFSGTDADIEEPFPPPILNQDPV